MDAQHYSTNNNHWNGRPSVAAYDPLLASQASRHSLFVSICISVTFPFETAYSYPATPLVGFLWHFIV